MASVAKMIVLTTIVTVLTTHGLLLLPGCLSVSFLVVAVVVTVVVMVVVFLISWVVPTCADPLGRVFDVEAPFLREMI